MSTVRINQRLTEPYNPDGTPGTVTTGAPGRPPTGEEITLAVSEYLTVHPPTVTSIPSVASVHNRFGAGATGQPGAFIDVSALTTGSLSVGGSISPADLTLSSLGGTVVVDDPLRVTGVVTLGNTLSTVSDISVGGMVVVADALRGTSLASLSSALTGVMAATVYTYVGPNGNTRRGLKTSELSNTLVSNGKADVLGMIATLWRALQEVRGMLP